jgi:aryl sulfotransferase
VFINKGTNGRWMETLTQDEVGEYEARAVEGLGPEAVHWQAAGEKI